MMLNKNMEESKIQLLKLWKGVAERIDESKHHYFKDYQNAPAGHITLGRDVEMFLKKPTEDNFKKFWNGKRIFSAQRRGGVNYVWGGNQIAILKGTIKEIFDASDYDVSWERLNNAYKSISELFGILHIESHPRFNSCAEKGLKFFSYRFQTGYKSFEKSFNRFKEEVYLKIVGHATKGSDHEVPINYEIDQLFNVIDKLKRRDIEEQNLDPHLKKFFEHLLEIKESNARDHDQAPRWDSSGGEILNLLNEKLQIIFYGPPGTGKTYKARKFAVEFLINEAKTRTPHVSVVLENSISLSSDEIQNTVKEIKKIVGVGKVSTLIILSIILGGGNAHFKKIWNFVRNDPDPKERDRHTEGRVTSTISQLLGKGLILGVNPETGEPAKPRTNEKLRVCTYRLSEKSSKSLEEWMKNSTVLAKK